MKNSLDMIQALRPRLASHWAPLNIAKDAYGNPCNATDKQARYWCIGGCVQNLTRQIELATTAMNFIGVAVDALFGSSVVVWEDKPERTREDILWILDCAEVLVRTSNLFGKISQALEPDSVKTNASRRTLDDYRATCFAMRPQARKVAA